MGGSLREGGLAIVPGSGLAYFFVKLSNWYSLTKNFLVKACENIRSLLTRKFLVKLRMRFGSTRKFLVKGDL